MFAHQHFGFFHRSLHIRASGAECDLVNASIDFAEVDADAFVVAKCSPEVFAEIANAVDT
ncbi:hypothetical protein X734_11110 [Mesorhizobium sp. L2C084A000]|nr:hypothetical protein X734_11110 [Mesorhizobium sp. L2C084A000]